MRNDRSEEIIKEWVGLKNIDRYRERVKAMKVCLYFLSIKIYFYPNRISNWESFFA